MRNTETPSHKQPQKNQMSQNRLACLGCLTRKSPQIQPNEVVKKSPQKIGSALAVALTLFCLLTLRLCQYRGGMAMQPNHFQIRILPLGLAQTVALTHIQFQVKTGATMPEGTIHD